MLEMGIGLVGEDFRESAEDFVLNFGYLMEVVLIVL
jgi:hypothetical protein